MLDQCKTRRYQILGRVAGEVCLQPCQLFVSRCMGLNQLADGRPPQGLQLDPKYGAMRESGRLFRITMPYGGEAWLATGYHDVQAVLSDTRFSRAATLGQDVPRWTSLIQSDPSLRTMDPPEHTRLRKLVANTFSVRRVEGLRPRVQNITDSLIDQLIDQGPPGDVVKGFAIPLPTSVICEVLGVPTDDWGAVHLWTDTVLAIDAYTPAEVAAGRESLKSYIAELVSERRRSSSGGLLAELVSARDTRNLLSEEELVMLGLHLLVAGQQTTVSQIGNMLYLLLTRDELRQQFAHSSDRAAVACAIEELLRYIPLDASPGSTRIALDDIELPGGLVRKGEAVVVQAASANRDREVFDQPEEVDLSRTPNPHLAFGYGVHRCLGAQLARLELQVAVRSLLERLPGIRLAVGEEELSWNTGMQLRGLRELPIEWRELTDG
jgi:cytochrome P450 RapN